MLAEAGPLKLDVDIKGDQAVLTLIGELDIATSVLLRDTVVALVAAPAGAPRVTIDLTELSFLDSARLRVVVRALSPLRRGGGECPRASRPRRAPRRQVVTSRSHGLCR